MQARGHGPSLLPFLASDFALASNRGVPVTPPQACYHMWTQPSLPWALAGYLPAHCLLQRAGLLPSVLSFPRSHWIAQISFLGSRLVQFYHFPARVLLLMTPDLGLSPALRDRPPLATWPPRHISCPVHL